jgi:hypothetical protein
MELKSNKDRTQQAKGARRCWTKPELPARPPSPRNGQAMGRVASVAILAFSLLVAPVFAFALQGKPLGTALWGVILIVMMLANRLLARTREGLVHALLPV